MAQTDEQKLKTQKYNQQYYQQKKQDILQKQKEYLQNNHEHVRNLDNKRASKKKYKYMRAHFSHCVLESY